MAKPAFSRVERYLCDTPYVDQIVGKIRLVQTPWINHSWHATLYVTSRGLTTSPIPHGTQHFRLVLISLTTTTLIQTSNGEVKILSLAPRAVADFYQELFAKLAELNL